MADLPKRELGRIGLQVTMLGYGAMELRGAPRGREVTEAQAETILHAALDAGINYIDTSIDYGLSEERIGRYIANRRSEYYLASKCGCVVGATPAPRGQRNPHVFHARQYHPAARAAPAGRVCRGQASPRGGGLRTVASRGWRFAPNAALDLEGSYLFAGAALGTAKVLNGVHTRLDPHDAYSLALRVMLDRRPSGPNEPQHQAQCGGRLECPRRNSGY